MSVRHYLMYCGQSVFFFSVVVVTPMLAFVFACDSDATTDELRNRPTVIEQWTSSSRQRLGVMSKTTYSPLVQEARRFALLLNPPLPERHTRSQTNEYLSMKSERPSPPEVRPQRTRPKFTLVATSCYPAKPSESMALISEPGQTTRWIKPGAELGYLVVDKILHGAIVCRDGFACYTVSMEAEGGSGQRQEGRLASEDPARLQRVARRIEKPSERSERRNVMSPRARPTFYRLGPVR